MQDNSRVRIVGRIVWYLCRFLFETFRTIVILTAVVLIGGYLYGIRPYVVVTGSMQPTIMTGSICFVNERVHFDEIQVQDIIAFRMGEDTIVTHRAVKIEEGTIFTRGDANNVEDASTVTESNFIGKIIFWIPEIGKYVFALRTKRGVMVVVLLVLAMFLGDLVLTASDPKNQTGNDHAQNNSPDKT